MVGKPKYASLREWLMAHVAPGDEDACWNWIGAVGSHGYGVGSFRHVQQLGHRSSYEVFVGPIPQGSHVLHTCDNQRCCNPQHLFVGSHDDNMADMVAKGRQSFGKRRPNAKLNPDAALAIRTSSALSQSSLAAMYGVNQSVISRVKSGNTWRAT